ncbi:MAG: membrane protein insertase YidC [Clostridia bacterium]|nr:membrane protein insertase YidC [Clostridia bacterium]
MTALWKDLLSGFAAALNLFYGWTGNYGWAIVLLTLAIRLALWPLTQSQLLSAKRMQELQPSIERLRKKYANDQQRLNEEMMKLFRENRINPAAGCLPMLVQLPFLWAIYEVLRTYEAFQGASFLWIANLRAADPYFVLPVLAAVATFAQMWLSSGKSGLVGPQRTMVFVMPLMVLLITRSLPAGLALYWVVSTLVSVAQQMMVPGRRVAEGGKAV